MSFYPVIELLTGKRRTRVYLQTRTSTFQPEQLEKIQSYIESVFKKNQTALDHGNKYVLIIWGENGIPMTDWWIWGEKESESEGASIEVYLFRGDTRYESPLVTAEDGFKVLVGEIELGD